VKSLEIGQNAGIAVTWNEDAIDEIRPWKMKQILGDRLARVAEEVFGLGAKGVLDFGEHNDSLLEPKKRSVQKIPSEFLGRSLSKGLRWRKKS
jgi:hypothetical protein